MSRMTIGSGQDNRHGFFFGVLLAAAGGVGLLNLFDREQSLIETASPAVVSS